MLQTGLRCRGDDQPRWIDQSPRDLVTSQRDADLKLGRTFQGLIDWKIENQTGEHDPLRSRGTRRDEQIVHDRPMPWRAVQKRGTHGCENGVSWVPLVVVSKSQFKRGQAGDLRQECRRSARGWDLGMGKRAIDVHRFGDR